MVRGALRFIALIAAAGCGGEDVARMPDGGSADAAVAALPPGTSWKPCDVLGASIGQLAYSGDGRWLGIAQVDGRVSLIKLGGTNGQSIQAASVLPRIALSRDGALVATATSGSVKLWTVADGTLVRELAIGSGEPVSLRFSVEPPPLLLAGVDQAATPAGNVKIWSVTDGALVAALTGSPHAIFTLADAGVLMLDESRGGFEVLGFDGRVIKRVTFPRPLARTAFASDGAFMAGVTGAGTSEERLATLSVGDDQFVWQSPETSQGTRQLIFLENPSRVVQLADRARIYDHANGNVLAAVPALDGALVAAPTPDGATLAVTTATGSISLVSTSDGEQRPAPVATFGVVGAITGFAASRDGRTLALSGRETTWIVNVGDGGLVRAIASPARARPQFSPDGTRVALGGATRAIYRLDDGVQELEIPVAAVDRACAPSLVFSPDGRWLASGSCGRVELFERDGTPLGEHPSQAPSPAVAFSPDSRHLATSGPELWTIDAAAPVWPATVMPGPAGVPPVDDGVTFSADGTRLLVSRSVQRATGWRTETALLRASDGGVLESFGVILGDRPSLSSDGAWVTGADHARHIASGTRAPLELSPRLAFFLPDQRIVAAPEGPLVHLFCPGR
jgi:WD40 repeat protein